MPNNSKPRRKRKPIDVMEDLERMIGDDPKLRAMIEEEKLNAEIARVLALPDIKDKLSSQGMTPLISTPDQFAAIIKADLAKFTKIIKTGNIKLEQ